jgi:hypothetical protein
MCLLHFASVTRDNDRGMAKGEFHMYSNQSIFVADKLEIHEFKGEEMRNGIYCVETARRLRRRLGRRTIL